MGISSWWETYLGEGDDPSLLVFLLRRKRRWLKGSLSPQRVFDSHGITQGKIQGGSALGAEKRVTRGGLQPLYGL
ncbi:uncharacterized protein CLUP02_00674 [Colletotrichum lupini]|uniref:Uncharacterized protein n=1 Tax=Colletotrichum lupini TaxID=145971 RepID=A0A9Q8SCK0_9PEZI|nr:uncharacterized protein CLUP02_00674 [Colletotrichum lupini]KAK1719686.1 hypothetical protein BDP67DRAFT_502437 [Colletotrichum lupini]UQC74027.1 hypothetical protein CLUP02_00674 [Colletotrichum lupini]